MAADRWPPEFLDAMRQVADPATDQLIRETLELPDGEAALVRLNRYLQTRNVRMPADLAPGVRRFLQAPVDLAWVDWSKLAKARSWFSEWGLLAMLSLFLKALPQYFANADADQVFRIMNIFRKGTLRRFLVEIAQLTFDVMEPGGLDVYPNPPQPGSQQTKADGVFALQKLRLHHSVIRHWTQQKPRLQGAGWDLAWGQPLNQEDLALAVTTFSLWTLDGVRKLTIPVNEAEEEGGLEVWKVMGFLIGLDDRLQPATTAEARELIEKIGKRQFRRSQAGIDLTRELLDRVEGFLPRWLRGFPVGLMRYLMEPRFVGLLEVPKPSALTRLALLLLGIFVKDVKLYFKATSRLAGRFLHGLQRVKDRDGDRGSFRIPARQIEKYG
jgi:hypothetical protein